MITTPPGGTWSAIVGDARAPKTQQNSICLSRTLELLGFPAFGVFSEARQTR